MWYVAVYILDQFSLVLSRRELALEASEQLVGEERLLKISFNMSQDSKMKVMASDLYVQVFLNPLIP